MHDMQLWIVWCSNLTVFNFSLFYPFNQSNSNIFHIFFTFESSIYQKTVSLRHPRLHTDKSSEIVPHYVDASSWASKHMYQTRGSAGGSCD